MLIYYIKTFGYQNDSFESLNITNYVIFNIFAIIPNTLIYFKINSL